MWQWPTLPNLRSTNHMEEYWRWSMLIKITIPNPNIQEKSPPRRQRTWPVHNYLWRTECKVSDWVSNCISNNSTQHLAFSVHSVYCVSWVFVCNGLEIKILETSTSIFSFLGLKKWIPDYNHVWLEFVLFLGTSTDRDRSTQYKCTHGSKHLFYPWVCFRGRTVRLFWPEPAISM